MELFSLFGKIMVDNDQANKSIAKTGKESDSLASKMGQGMKKAALWGAAIGTAAVVVGKKVLDAGNKFSESADKIDKSSTRMGVTTDYYQKLQYAMSQCGVEMSVMEKAAKKLEGTDLSFEDAMAQINALGTETERTTKAQELFGNAIAYQMAPALKVGGAEINGMMQKAEDLGMVMSADAVNSGVKFKDTMDTLKQALSGVGGSIMAELMPYLVKAAEWMIQKGVPSIRKGVDIIKKVITTLKPYISSIIGWIADMYNKSKPYIDKLIQTIGNIYTKFNDVKNKIAGIVSAIKGFFSNFHISIPTIKMPHFKIEPNGWQIGDLLKGSIPKLGIDWYAKAMDRGMILDKPTIFGEQNGKLLGAGERGSETVVGTDSLMDMIQNANNTELMVIANRLNKIINLIEDGKNIYIDSAKVSRSLAPSMNRELAGVR